MALSLSKGLSKTDLSISLPPMDLVQQAHEFLTKSGGQTNSPAIYILRLSILRLSSGAYYVGATTNLFQRMTDHASSAGGKTTRDFPPETLLFVELHSSFSSARKREAQIKRWSRSKKEALALGNYEILIRLSRSRC